MFLARAFEIFFFCSILQVLRTQKYLVILFSIQRDGSESKLHSTVAVRSLCDPPFLSFSVVRGPLVPVSRMVSRWTLPLRAWSELSPSGYSAVPLPLLV